MRVLMIGAHQDDNEFRGGGLAHKYVQMGYEVRFLSLCNGCGGHHIMTPQETTARRAKESAAVASLLGIGCKRRGKLSLLSECFPCRTNLL